MGSALVEGALNTGIITSDNLFLSDQIPESSKSLASKTQGQIAESNLQIAQTCDLVLLAIKPYQILELLAEISPALPGNTALISIAAGITLTKMEAASPNGTRIIRAMPNTPCMIGMGATGITAGQHATPNDMAAAQNLLESVGIVVTTTEPQLDAVTGVSGSGPAYIYTVIKAIAEQGTIEGLNPKDALQLATRTVMGAAHMIEHTQKPPQELIDQVTSPGGTTLAGLAALAEHDFEKTIATGVHAATERSREIATES